MRIKRDDLEKWIDADDLEHVIWGGFVKINQGEGNNQTIYKIMRVVGLKTLTPYYFGKKETSKWIKMYEFDIKIAKSFKMKLISNQEISEQEFDHWKQMQDDSSSTIIARHEILTITKNITEMRKRYNSLKMMNYQSERALFQEIESGKVRRDPSLALASLKQKLVDIESQP